MDIAFDQEKYLNLEKKANSIEALFLLNNKFICRIVNNNTTNEKYLQIYQEFNLVYEKKIPFTFKFIGVYKKNILGIINDSENQKKLCILEQF